jgi:hypothetical protein
MEFFALFKNTAFENNWIAFVFFFLSDWMAHYKFMVM